MFKTALGLGLASSVAFLLMTSLAAANPITWNLQNATLVGGGAVTGSFTFDPTTDIYSNININTPSAHYGIPDPVSPGNANVLIAVESGLSNYTGTPELAINWAAPLTNAGGTDPFNLTGYTFQGICGNASCTTGARTASFASGSATSATNVPEPSSLSLLAFGLLGLMGFAYRSPRVRV